MEYAVHPLIIVFGVVAVAMGIASGLIWYERRLLAVFQDRYGPNRVGPFGLLQVLADMIKIFFKEDWVPPFADRLVFIMAPAVIMATVLLSFAVIPFAPGIVVRRSSCGFALLPGDVLLGRIQRSPGRLVFEQQIRPAWQPAWGGPDDQLRSVYGPFAGGGDYAGRLF
jgi:NADH:ubiquinone oxidoreductase subunit H